MENSACLSCAENIALFHFLHAGRGKDGGLCKDSVPALPSISPVEAPPTNHRNYILSFERERSLTSALAFISQIKDNPDNVTAVCIQEDQEPREEPRLRVLLAVNKSKFGDGNSVLERIRKGFQSVFKELSQVVDHGRFLSSSNHRQQAANDVEFRSRQ